MVVGAVVARKKRVARFCGYIQIALALMGLIEVIRRFTGAEAMPDFRIMIGTSLALGAEYEMKDYSSTRFFYTDYDQEEMSWETGTAKDMLKAAHTLRLGAEYKLTSALALRAGYNLSTSAFEKSAYKALYENTVITDTDYANTQRTSDYTFGLGYRGNGNAIWLATSIAPPP